MRKYFVIICIIAVMFSLCEYGECRQKENLWEMLSDSKEVKTYVADVTDSSGDASDMLTGLKKALEDALATRMTINFVLVEAEEEADIVVKSDITERIWLENDPVDQIHGLSSAALDAAISENYGRLQALFTVERGGKDIIIKPLRRIAKRRNIIWKQKLQATVTKKDMPEEASKPLLEERIISVFMRKCFSKNSKPLN